MTRFQAMRMIWIDFFLQSIECSEHGMNRNDLEVLFNISTAQASKDLQMYQRLFPHRLFYDKSRKAYFKQPGTQPICADWYHQAVDAMAVACMNFCEAVADNTHLHSLKETT